MVLDLRSIGRGLNSGPLHCRAAALDNTVGVRSADHLRWVVITTIRFDFDSVYVLRSSIASLFTVHCLRWRMSPFMRQCWGLPHRLAQCMRPQGWGKLVNAALLSLINEACVIVCCATLLSSELVGPACVQARSSNPRGRACGPSGKGSGDGGGGDIEWRCTCIFIQPGF